MRVAVVGPGSMGCLFAARLAHSGIHTTLVDYRPERAARLRQSGIVVESAQGDLTANPDVALRIPERQDLIVVMTKSYSLEGLRFPPDVPLLTLQNGLGNVEVLCANVGSARVLAGATCEAATLVSEGRVHHSGTGLTQVGAWTSAPAKPVVDALVKAGFEVAVTDSPGQMLWEKASINNGINTLTALLGVPNGQLLRLSEARQLMRDLVVEAVKVASTEGYRFEFSLVERTEEVCQQTAENISSMLQDIRAGRQTEIDSISGEILRRAQLAALPTPRTRMIWQLVKSLEQR